LSYSTASIEEAKFLVDEMTYYFPAISRGVSFMAEISVVMERCVGICFSLGGSGDNLYYKAPSRKSKEVVIEGTTRET